MSHETMVLELPPEARSGGAYEGFDARCPETQGAKLHLTAVRSGVPVARASLWWDGTPSLDGRRSGAIGHYAAGDAEASSALLDAACRRLSDAGAEVAIGPMDGNTWRPYRFVTEGGDEPAFAMEPTNPPQYPRYWEESGFVPLAGYSSALDRTLESRDGRMARVEQRMAAEDIGFRCVDTGDFPAELSRIYAVARESFPQNFLYTPLSEADFLALYLPYEAYVVPQLALVAEDASGPVGFMFALPDLAQAKRGEAVDTVILKTLAVLPGRRHGGLGSLLVERVRDAAREMGFRRAVYALMYDSNVSRNIAEHFGETMRRYTLYRKDLP